ncbi:MAG: YjbQ family protein [Elusimicrobia bacterium]|nr:YjbQ family protein [Elusimicrobiota bacterium]
MTKTRKFVLETGGFTDIIDITGRIRDFVDSEKIEDGLVSVFVKGSTGGVTTIEYEPNLVKDFRNAMEKIAPSDARYEHAKTWNDDNGSSHVRASVIGPSQTIPVSRGELMLGTWQQVIVIDFDTRPRKREVFLTGIT